MAVKIREKIRGSSVYWVFLHHKGMRASHQIGTLKDAEEFKEKLEARLKLGMDPIEKPVPSESKLTLRKYYETFDKVYLTGSCRESTRLRYADTFRNYIAPVFGDMPVTEIARTQVKEFVADLVGKGLARATIRIIVSNLCTVFSHAIEDEILQVNPAVKMPKFFRQAYVLHDEIQPLTADEVGVFLSTAIDLDHTKRYRDVPEYYPLFLCAVHTGMRAGELIALQWSDIDWRSKYIVVRRSIKDGRINLPKNGKTRKVDMSDLLIAELQGMRKRRIESYLKDGKNRIPEWVFCNSDGNFLDIQNLKNRHFHKCLEVAKLRRIRFHDLSYVLSLIMF
jgi:integrase